MINKLCYILEATFLTPIVYTVILLQEIVRAFDYANIETANALAASKRNYLKKL